MPLIKSECCEFEVGYVQDGEAYCYACGTSHRHRHLDLRSLRQTILGQVTERHIVNWEELKKDKVKYASMNNGDMCQSMLTEMNALCPHGKQLHLEGNLLSLHVCFSDHGPVDLGLDFTVDLCEEKIGQKTKEGHLKSVDVPEKLREKLETIAADFQIGDVLRYKPGGVFEKVA